MLMSTTRSEHCARSSMRRKVPRLLCRMPFVPVAHDQIGDDHRDVAIGMLDDELADEVDERAEELAKLRRQDHELGLRDPRAARGVRDQELPVVGESSVVLVSVLIWTT